MSLFSFFIQRGVPNWFLFILCSPVQSREERYVYESTTLRLGTPQIIFPAEGTRNAAIRYAPLLHLPCGTGSYRVSMYLASQSMSCTRIPIISTTMIYFFMRFTMCIRFGIALREYHHVNVHAHLLISTDYMDYGPPRIWRCIHLRRDDLLYGGTSIYTYRM